MNKFVVSSDATCAINVANASAFYIEADGDKSDIKVMLTNGSVVTIAAYEDEKSAASAYRRLLDFLEITDSTKQDVYYINSRPDESVGLF